MNLAQFWLLGVPILALNDVKLGVFGITRKLFENAREWCSCHADNLDKFQIIQASNLEIHRV